MWDQRRGTEGTDGNVSVYKNALAKITVIKS